MTAEHVDIRCLPATLSTARRQLSDRFRLAIDGAAMKGGLVGMDE